MTKYAPGMRAIIRDEEWLIKKVYTNTLSNDTCKRITLQCQGISPMVKDREAHFIAEVEDIAIVDPAQIKLIPDVSPFYRRSQLFIESQWRQQMPTSPDLYIGHRAAMDLMPYQLEPAKLALSRPRQRLLIADAVGLGKTLEAGILMSELIARGRGKRILVVAVKSMMAQFQQEMWNRFTIPLVRLDSTRIQRIRATLPSNYNPFFYYDKTIISVDTLKRDLEYRTHLENAYWDIIVIDEAQNVAERSSFQAQRARLATLLAGRSDTMIMLSATPHDGRARSFASLMNMLDPTAIANPDQYTPETIKGLFIRRFKKDVKDQVACAFQERQDAVEHCPASPREEEAFARLAELNLQMDARKPFGSGLLFKTSLEKALFSSPAACIKSIDERVHKLMKKYPGGDFPDIAALNGLKEALVRVESADFSRYQKLLALLRSREYAWSKAADDRLVIFTERIETMRFLAENLRRDLHLPEKAVEEMSGAMSDIDQQAIVERFGRSDAPVRILVASDVASEGLNLHYLCHRLIHFDIPWSLMVFQQRNGRIDRYGQPQRPDIRYMFVESAHPRIKGDLRIIEILIDKEKAARDNIGDPALLLGKFSVEEEELVIKGIVERGADVAALDADLAAKAQEFNPFEMLMALAQQAAKKPASTVHTRETLFSDLDYLQQAIAYLNRTESQPVEKLRTVSGLDIKMTPDLSRRLHALMPEEALPEGERLRVSDDKRFCMEEMQRCRHNGVSASGWPQTQYLWPLHPIMTWANDKNGLLFGRGEAPIITLPDLLKAGETIFVVTGSMPNAKSQPLVDEWFGLHFQGEQFLEALTMEQVLQRTRLRSLDNPNTADVSEQEIEELLHLRPLVVEQAKVHLHRFFDEYRERMRPLIDQELANLADLEVQHREYQKAHSLGARRQDEATRKVVKLFEEFSAWVQDTLKITDTPYIRIVAALQSGRH